MKNRLEKIGLRSINAVVDITNFLTYDRGRPLHAYNSDLISKNIGARLAKVGEKIKALDGKEYILVLEGSFCDEYGKYSRGDIQINDQKIKHTPIASQKDGCICLTITEKDVIFYGKFGSFLNLFTFIRSFFK